MSEALYQFLKKEKVELKEATLILAPYREKAEEYFNSRQMHSDAILLRDILKSGNKAAFRQALMRVGENILMLYRYQAILMKAHKRDEESAVGLLKCVHANKRKFAKYMVDNREVKYKDDKIFKTLGDVRGLSDQIRKYNNKNDKVSQLLERYIRSFETYAARADRKFRTKEFSEIIVLRKNPESFYKDPNNRVFSSYKEKDSFEKDMLGFQFLTISSAKRRMLERERKARSNAYDGDEIRRMYNEAEADLNNLRAGSILAGHKTTYTIHGRKYPLKEINNVVSVGKKRFTVNKDYKVVADDFQFKRNGQSFFNTFSVINTKTGKALPASKISYVILSDLTKGGLIVSSVRAGKRSDFVECEGYDHNKTLIPANISKTVKLFAKGDGIRENHFMVNVLINGKEMTGNSRVFTGSLSH